MLTFNPEVDDIGTFIRYSGQMGPACGGNGIQPVNSAHLIHITDLMDMARLNPKMERWARKADTYWDKHYQLPGYLQKILDFVAYRAVGWIKTEVKGLKSQTVLIFVPWLTKDFLLAGKYASLPCESGKAEDCDCLPCKAKTKGQRITAGILRAIKTAKMYGAAYVGLGAFTSIHTKNGLLVVRKAELPVTSGSDGTAYAILVCIDAASQQLGIDLSVSKLTFVGASGAVGTRACMLLAPLFRRVTLCARNIAELAKVSRLLVEIGVDPKRIEIETDINRAVHDADVTILAASVAKADDLGLDYRAIKAGSLVADVGTPKNFGITDLGKLAQLPYLVVDGANISLPGEFQDESWKLLNQGGRNSVWGCSAETILRGLLGCTNSTSIGRPKPQDINGLRKLATEMDYYGFQFAGLRSRGQEISPERIQAVRKIRLQEAK